MVPKEDLTVPKEGSILLRTPSRPLRVDSIAPKEELLPLRVPS
jgi:hypothetical protein